VITVGRTSLRVSLPPPGATVVRPTPPLPSA